MAKPTQEEYDFFDKLHGKEVDNPTTYSGESYGDNKEKNGGHSITSWYKSPIFMPTQWLMGLKGKNGEHERLMGPKPDGSGNYGAPGDKHPAVYDMLDRMKKGEYKFKPIHVVGQHAKEPTIYEGNHRTHAADEMDMEYAPVEFQHVNGNEKYFHPLDIIHDYEDKMHPENSPVKPKLPGNFNPEAGEIPQSKSATWITDKIRI